MKKKLLFMLINMNVGGTEKALLNMLKELPQHKYDITIFMLEKYGGFLNYLPKEVTVKYYKDYNKIKALLNNPPHLTALDLMKKGKILNAFKIIILHIISKIKGERSDYFRSILKSYPQIREEFDIAVAFDGPMDFVSYFILNKVKAKKRIQWIHFDINKIGFNSIFASKIYNHFDRVFVVSEEAKDHLIENVPKIKNKTEVFSNIISPNLILSQLGKDKGFSDSFDGLRILTVGRLTNEKGQDLAIQVLRRLINEGYNVRWYCVGDGINRVKLKKLVEEYKLQETFILLGATPNPYPFMEQCDIYVQPSRHEGYCIALAEARCLKKPIVTTDTAGALEQIKNGKTGLIVNVDENELYNAILKLIKDKTLRDFLSKNLGEEKFCYSNEINKLNQLL